MKKAKITTAFVCLVMTLTALAEGKVNIWQDTDCKAKVKMTPYLAAGNSNVAVVVCPGGSYFWHDMEAEGTAVGKWLQSNGISAFVLCYRTAGWWAFFSGWRSLFPGRQHPDAINDLRQALTFVRQHAADYGVNPDSIGAMGFSAGGHLVMSAAELLPANERPAFLAPIYPVVTMTDACVHKRSRRALLGEKRVRNQQMRDSLSMERHVPKDCPAVFLVNCKDDPVVKCRNSELLDSALTAQGVEHRYIQYATGGHGFGASQSKGTAECRQWKNEFLNWLRHLNN